MPPVSALPSHLMPPPPRPSGLGAASVSPDASDDRRESLSPNKRRREPDDDDDPSPASSSEASQSTVDVSYAAVGGGGGSDDDAGRASSPTKRQARAPAFGQAHALSRQLRKGERTTVIDMFSPGMLRVPVFRIPSLLTLPEGVCLAFAEARPHLHDSGVIDLVLRRSTDHGRTWAPARVILEGGMIGAARNATVGNPTAVFDRRKKVVWLLLCSNHADDAEWQIHARAGRESRRVWVTSSADLGKTWAKPHEITKGVKHQSWTWYATGPGVGVQLENGRLLVPCNHAEDVHEPDCPYLVHQRRSRMVSHAIYSDDHGKTWHVGGIAADHTNECCLAALPSGRVLLNCRDWSGRFQRVKQFSTDGGLTFKGAQHDPTLIEPEPQGCQGSMIAVAKHPSEPDAGGAAGDKGIVFFCNPSSDRREMLTVRRSDDGGATWSRAFCLEEGPSAYSCLGLTHDGYLGVLYERGGQISFARIPSAPDGPLGVF
jgi:sialidase-1